MKRTLYFQGPNRSRAILGQSDTTVYVLHPDSPQEILEMPHKTIEAASATFAKVRHEYFHPRIGYHLREELATIAPETWIFKWTPEQMAHHARVADARKGYMKDGTRMAMSVYNVDLDAVFANAADVTWLHVLIGLDNTLDVHCRPVLMNLFAKGAAPQVSELLFESPWFDLRDIPLKLPAKLLERPALQRLAAVGADAWPVQAKPKHLTHLRLDTNLTPDMLAAIASVRSLQVLQLRINRKTETAAREQLTDRAFAELSISVIGDVVAMIDALLDAKQRPAVTRLSVASVRKGTKLRPAVERWQREADGAKLQLDLWRADDEAKELVTAAGMDLTASEYSTNYPPEHRHLISPFQPINYNGPWKA